jgi:hypothetical protein
VESKGEAIAGGVASNSAWDSAPQAAKPFTAPVVLDPPHRGQTAEIKWPSSAPMFLVLMLRSGRRPPAGGMGMKVDVDMTLLGFRLPFAGAIATTFVSVKKNMKPA